jgi:hypothetical protein
MSTKRAVAIGKCEDGAERNKKKNVLNCLKLFKSGSTKNKSEPWYIPLCILDNMEHNAIYFFTY